jgi:hypothetical protein
MSLKSNEIIENILESRGKLPHLEAPLNKCDEEGF